MRVIQLEGRKRDIRGGNAFTDWICAVEDLRITPNTVAVRQGEVKVQIKQVEQLSLNVATLCLHHSNRQGFEAPCVTVHAELSPLLVCAVVGAALVGTYVPLDIAGPHTLYCEILSKVRPHVLLCSDLEYSRVLADHAITLGCCCEQLDAIPDAEGTATLRSLASNTLSSQAYVLHTSGSTGIPKGVVGTHSGLLNRLQWFLDEFPYVAGDRTLQRTSPIFVDSFLENLLPLFGVNEIVIPTHTALSNPTGHDIVVAIQTQSVRRIVVVPTLIRLISSMGKIPVLQENVTHIFSSGECLTHEIASLIFENHSNHISIINLYGCTEVMDAIFEVCTSTNFASRVAPNIGRPIFNTLALLGSNSSEPYHTNLGDAFVEPPHAAKCMFELRICGASVSPSYFEMVELTSKKFSKNDHKDWYTFETGDLVTKEDDKLHFHGRKDLMVKVNGNRVELRMIESALEQVEGIEQCIASMTSSGGIDVLTAYLSLGEKQKNSLTTHQCEDALRGRVPPYAIPSQFYIVDEFPLTQSNKIDRNATSRLTNLTKVSLLTSQMHRGSDACQITQAAITAVVQQYLANISDDCTFWDAGMTSLNALQICENINLTFNTHVQVEELLHAATVGDLYALLQGQCKAGIRSGSEFVEERPAKFICPDFSFFMLRNGNVSKSRRTSKAFKTATQHMQNYVCIRGEIDIDRIQSSFYSLLRTEPWTFLTGQLDFNNNDYSLVLSDFGVPFFVRRRRGRVPSCNSKLVYALHEEELVFGSSRGRLYVRDQFGQSGMYEPIEFALQDEMVIHDVHIDRAVCRVQVNVYDDGAVLGVSCAHTLLDGWSLNALIRAWGSIYSDISCPDLLSFPVVEHQASELLNLPSKHRILFSSNLLRRCWSLSSAWINGISQCLGKKLTPCTLTFTPDGIKTRNLSSVPLFIASVATILAIEWRPLLICLIDTRFKSGDTKIGNGSVKIKCIKMPKTPVVADIASVISDGLSSRKWYTPTFFEFFHSLTINVENVGSALSCWNAIHMSDFKELSPTLSGMMMAFCGHTSDRKLMLSVKLQESSIIKLSGLCEIDRH